MNIGSYLSYWKDLKYFKFKTSWLSLNPKDDLLGPEVPFLFIHWCTNLHWRSGALDQWLFQSNQWFPLEPKYMHLLLKWRGMQMAYPVSDVLCLGDSCQCYRRLLQKKMRWFHQCWRARLSPMFLHNCSKYSLEALDSCERF